MLLCCCARARSPAHKAAGSSLHHRTRPTSESRRLHFASLPGTRPRNHAQTTQLSNWPQAPEQHRIPPRRFSLSSIQSTPKMPPKARVPEKPSVAAHSAPVASKSNKGGSLDAQAIVQDVWGKYVQKTPQRVKLLDSFMVFLVVVGVLQFAYCLIVGNFVRIHPRPLPELLAIVYSNSRIVHEISRGSGISNTAMKTHLLTCPPSPSTPSSPASAQPSASSCSPPPSASRPTPRTNLNSKTSRTSARSLISFSAR